MRVQTHESTQTPDPWDLAESLTVKWYNNFHRWWKKWLGFSPLKVGANETELVYTLIHNGNGCCHQQTITTQRSCHRITDVIFNICKKITTVLLLQNLCTCLFFFFLFFDHDQTLRQILTLINEKIVRRNSCVWQNYYIHF